VLAFLSSWFHDLAQGLFPMGEVWWKLFVLKVFFYEIRIIFEGEAKIVIFTEIWHKWNILKN